jgi:hypothetical protein
VLGTLLILLVVWGGLVAMLWAGTLVLQAYVYEEATSGLAWRAPAAAGALTLFFALFALLHYHNPDTFDTLTNFSDAKTTDFDRLWAVKKGGTKKERYHKDALKGVYVSDETNRPWVRESADGIVEAIEVEEDGQRVVFRAELQDGKFKSPETRYVEEEGKKRVMTEIGRLTTTRSGSLFVFILIHLIHLGLWFVCLWLLLRFQWPLALGLAFPLWLVASLAILPVVLAPSSGS